MSSMLSAETTGADAIVRTLQKIADAQTRIARNAVNAGTYVAAQACRQVAPGSTKREIGRFVKAAGAFAYGRAGLMALPKRNQAGKGPHGVYLDQGTKFIPARHFIGNALASARAPAINAMSESVNRTIETVASQS